jgi:phosphopantetheinyl transferase
MEEGLTLEEAVLHFGALPEVSIDYGTSEIYSEDEIKEAMIKIKCDFAGWEGCELHSLRYAGDESNTEENIEWLNSINEDANYTEVAEFLTDFHSPLEGEGAWNLDSEYTDYQWWLGHTEDGKPFFPDLPQIHFSLSHSGEYIACAFSDEEVGLDLQECSRPRTSIFRIAKRFFSQAEYEAILALSADKAAESCINDSGSDSPGNPDDPECLSLFYRLWSIKEAYLKYLGWGLRGGMNGYLPDPLPDSRYAEEKAGRTQANPGNAPQGTDSGKGRSIELIPQAGSGKYSMENFLPRGKILVINNDPLLAPAEYALAQAPENYTLAVCAEKIPAEILIKVI